MEKEDDFKKKYKRGLTKHQLARAEDVDFEDVKNEEPVVDIKTENNQNNTEQIEGDYETEKREIERKWQEELSCGRTYYFKKPDYELIRSFVNNDKNIKQKFNLPDESINRIDIAKSGKEVAEILDEYNPGYFFTNSSYGVHTVPDIIEDAFSSLKINYPTKDEINEKYGVELVELDKKFNKIKNDQTENALLDDKSEEVQNEEKDEDLENTKEGEKETITKDENNIEFNDENFDFRMFGAPLGYELADNYSEEEELKNRQNFYQMCYDGSRNNKEFKLDFEERKNIMTYVYKKNNLFNGEGRPGSFLGMSIEFKGIYCKNPKKLYDLFDSIFEELIVKKYSILRPLNGRSKTISGEAITHEFNMTDFKGQLNNITEIKEIIKKNLNKILVNDFEIIDEINKKNIVPKSHTMYSFKIEEDNNFNTQEQNSFKTKAEEKNEGTENDLEDLGLKEDKEKEKQEKMNAFMDKLIQSIAENKKIEDKLVELKKTRQEIIDILDKEDEEGKNKNNSEQSIENEEENDEDTKEDQDINEGESEEEKKEEISDEEPEKEMEEPEDASKEKIKRVIKMEDLEKLEEGSNYYSISIPTFEDKYAHASVTKCTELKSQKIEKEKKGLWNKIFGNKEITFKHDNEIYWEVSYYGNNLVLKNEFPVVRCNSEEEMLKKVSEIYNRGAEIYEKQKEEEKQKEIKLIKEDKELKPYEYFITEKVSNPYLNKYLQNENVNSLDLRKYEKGNYYWEWNILKRTAENEGYFKFDLFGFTKIIKNVKEITVSGEEKEKNGIYSKSNEAIYKIIGPNGEIVADDIHGYNKMEEIYKQKVEEYIQKVDKEFINR